MKKPLDVFVMQKVKEFRLRHNLLASDIADVIGTSVNFVNNVETPTSPDKYNLYHFVKIVCLFQCDPSELLPTSFADLHDVGYSDVTEISTRIHVQKSKQKKKLPHTPNP